MNSNEQESVDDMDVSEIDDDKHTNSSPETSQSKKIKVKMTSTNPLLLKNESSADMEIDLSADAKTDNNFKEE